jgi:hypothetical protein
MSYHLAGRGKIGAGRVVVVLDESVEHVAARRIHVTARSSALPKECSVFEWTPQNDHDYTLHLVRDDPALGRSAREFVTRTVWRWESESVLLVATKDASNENRYPVRASPVRGSITQLEKFERLEPIGAAPQTRITWTRQVQLGGGAPKKALAANTVKELAHASDMRVGYDKSPAIDAASRVEIEKMIKSHRQEYTFEEEGMVRAGIARLTA